MLPGAGLQIVLQSGATLNAPATQDRHIIFTSLADNTVGGDTNGEGDESTPMPGDWNGFIVPSGATLNLSQYVDVRYLVQTCSGTLSSSETLLGTNVYVVTRTIVVPSGVTLSIVPGAIVKFDAGQGITVLAGGQLVADGSVAQPIIFTSIKDDANGGDTNGDGSTTSPAPGDWNQILNEGVASFDHVEVLYGSDTAMGETTSGAVRNSGGIMTFADSVLSKALYDGLDSADGGSVVITTCLFTDDYRAVLSYNSTITVVNSTFDNNNYAMWDGATITATNCIVSNSLDAGVATWSSTTITYCDVWTSIPGAVELRDQQRHSRSDRHQRRYFGGPELRRRGRRQLPAELRLALH